MSTARSTGPASSSRPTSSAPSRCLQAALRYWRGLDRADAAALPLPSHLDRRGVRLARPTTGCSPRRRPTRRTRPTPPPRRRPTIWCAPGTRPTACPTLLTNCSNNYGPYHFPEKLIPLMIIKALDGQAAAGLRQWRQRARLALCRGPCPRARPRGRARRGRRDLQYRRPAERSNIDVVREICRLLDELRAVERDDRREELITFVTDRPGHDRRYAIDASKIERELGWRADRDLRDRARQDGALVSRQPRLVAIDSRRAAIARSASVWPARPILPTELSIQRRRSTRASHRAAAD